MRMASMRESRDSDQFLVNTQVQSHALLRRGFGTSVPSFRNHPFEHSLESAKHNSSPVDSRYIAPAVSAWPLYNLS